jgi:phosphomannomutase
LIKSKCCNFSFYYKIEATMKIKFGTDGWRGLIAEDYTFDSVRRAAQLSRSSQPQRCLTNWERFTMCPSTKPAWDSMGRAQNDGWMLIRFSGTEPIMRVYCETTHQDKVQAILQDGLKVAGLKS